ncbi:MAG: MBL fold metallo-hydrolase [Marinicaulis sp.]|nr:MBL fold metallo-hydrolase [Marinicaulis sp.]NNL88852.1 MBL fold metallo-hydrolase [Marinicaulis sp.]
MKRFVAAICCAAVFACAGEQTEKESDAIDPETEPASQSTPAIAAPPANTPTEITKRANEKFGASLPLDDESDFGDARRGFLAAIEDAVIEDENGRIVWDMRRFQFIKGDAPASVNPSLWRQAKLNNIHGLFEVVDGVYQVRGYDLSVMTVIRGETGWILIDPLLSKAPAAASLDLVNRTLGERPATAVLFTHSHGDHFGGVRGVVTDEDVAAGKVRLIAPEGFAESAVAENVIAGNAMARRAQFQFATQIVPGPTGPVDSGIGKALSSDAVGFMQPTETVTETGQRLTIDGVEFIFINAPDTEAPAEFMFYIPQYKALHTAELATGTMHNVLTLRGAKVRDALAWSKRIDDALTMFGDKADVVLSSHNWPTWGKEEGKSYLANQRDAYRWIHDQTMRLANQGYTMHEIADIIGEPDFMREDFSTRGYYGTVNHNSKATYQRYFGWWDGNPANLNPHPPEAQAKRMVDLAGGGVAMIKNAAKAYDEGDYRWVASIMNYLVFAEPDNELAKSFLAAAYEQLGFQSESSIWRNYYLTAAHELRNGTPRDNSINITNPDFVKAVPSADYFDALAIRVSPEKANKAFALNFEFDDTGEQFGVKVNDGVAVQKQALFDDDAITTIKLNRADLDDITLGRASFQSKLADGSIQVVGNPLEFGQFLLVHDQFNLWFNVVTP